MTSPRGSVAASSYRPSSLLLAGGGLANGLIAYRLSQRRPEVPFTLVEGGPRFGGNHTWSFFHTDLGPNRDWIAPFITQSWDAYDVRFPKRRRTIANGYHSITSERFHDVLTTALGDRALADTPIAALEPDGARLSDGGYLKADVVIDGRGPMATPDLVLGYQKFLGQTVRLTRDHGVVRPVIMDATVDQGGEYRFFYVLPWDARTLLIEDTRYTDNGDLNMDDLRRGVGEYAQAKGWIVDAVLNEEQGLLPVAMDGDIEGHWRRAEGRALSGLRAALFHPTTGYSLLDAAALADSLCDLPVIDATSVERLVRETSIRLWRERGLFRLVNRMLFRAARPGQGYRALQRFYGLSAPLIGRFYAAKPTRLDKLRILCGWPPVPFFAALDCVGEEGHA